MELTIVNKTDEKLFDRELVEFELKHNGPTPKLADVRKELCAKIGVAEEFVSVRKLATKYGGGLSRGRAYIYRSKASFDVHEPKYILVRQGLAQKEEKKEQKAEQATEVKKE